MLFHIAIAIAVAAIHLIATIAVLSRSVFPNPPSGTWGAVLSVLAFPLLHFGNARVGGIDLFDWMAVANSVVWGATFAAVLAYVRRRRRVRREFIP